MVMQNLKEIISEKAWTILINNYSPYEICRQASFRESMYLAAALFFEDFQNDANQQFGLRLLVEIKKYFVKDWTSDWKNDVYLGDMYSLLYFDKEAYEVCKRAYESLPDPPECLLLRLADCYFDFEPKISETEYESFIKRAIEKKLTAESALMMRTFYQRRNNQNLREYWDKIYQKLEEENIHTECITPDILKDYKSYDKN